MRRNGEIVDSGIQERAENLRLAGKSLRKIGIELGVSYEWVRQLSKGVTKGKKSNLVLQINPEDPGLSLLARDFAVHCRRLRKRLKKTQEQFGKLLQVANASVTVSKWESGKHTPRKVFLRRFLEIQRKLDNGHK